LFGLIGGVLAARFLIVFKAMFPGWWNNHWQLQTLAKELLQNLAGFTVPGVEMIID
jgi:hypothetical protein